MFLPTLINNKEYTIMKEIMKKKGIISDFQKRKLTPFGGKFFCKISIQLLSRMRGGVGRPQSLFDSYPNFTAKLDWLGRRLYILDFFISII